MEFLKSINDYLTDQLGPFGPLIVVGALGLFMILLTLPMLLNQPEDPLKKLKRIGIQIAVDDFGTGYSSLSYLKKFPLDILKIDRTFIAEIMNGTSKTGIVKAIIAMANSLNLRIIAEGLEGIEQVRFLREQGVHVVQGFYFSKPLPGEEFERFLTNNEEGEAKIIDLLQPKSRLEQAV